MVLDGPAVGVVFDGDALAAHAGFLHHAVSGVVGQLDLSAFGVAAGGEL